jgi:hypothetical protein
MANLDHGNGPTVDRKSTWHSLTIKLNPNDSHMTYRMHFRRVIREEALNNRVAALHACGQENR